jgi:hypothetical protein
MEAFDWNCQQHITPRFTAEEIQEAMAPLESQMRELQRENKSLREALARAEQQLGKRDKA